MVPANRYGFLEFSGVQLKTIQEIITLIVFAGFAVFYLGEGRAGTIWRASAAWSPRRSSFSAISSQTQAARTFTVICPIPAISQTITSPGTTGPTPSGVPVMMMSPGWSV